MDVPILTRKNRYKRYIIFNLLKIHSKQIKRTLKVWGKARALQEWNVTNVHLWTTRMPGFAINVVMLWTWYALNVKTTTHQAASFVKAVDIALSKVQTAMLMFDRYQRPVQLERRFALLATPSMKAHLNFASNVGLLYHKKYHHIRTSLVILLVSG